MILTAARQQFLKRAFSRVIHERFEALCVLCAQFVRNAANLWTLVCSSVRILDVIFILNGSLVLDVLLLIALANEAIHGAITVLCLHILGRVVHLGGVLLCNIVILIDDGVLVRRHNNVMIAALSGHFLNDGLGRL